MTEFMRNVVRKLHAPARRNFPRRKVDIRDKDETWQADLVDMIDHLWAVELKSKTGREVSAAMDLIFKKGRVFKNLHVDQETEFYNSIFQAMLQGTYKWVKILPKLIEQYNNTKHRTIKMAPAKVAIPIKSKTGEDVTAAMKSVHDEERIPKN
ncbi:uncharacterized protein LOC122850443 [Aphidius gifuensis]|uniref:uncharacterized protein LOC122850443 n=1 Tax=Aphidius gifuensis TaxID=684658 RepID=UPI001CDD80D7|nr:uncharacterized protein LOC122850443 [Aphidius gifuensis]